MADEINLEVVDYRLKNIENQLSELKDLLVQVPMLNKEIADMDKRLSFAEADIKTVKEDINRMKIAPVKKSAERWQYIIDYIFKGLVALAVAYLFAYKG